MATQSELHRLVGRAVTDGDFFRTFKRDPLAAAEAAGISLSDEQKRWLGSHPAQLTEFISRTETHLGFKDADCGTCLLDGH